MAHTMGAHSESAFPEDRRAVLTTEAAAPAHQAYKILYVGFILLPIVAGLDKFAGILADWDHYLAPVIASALPITAHQFMLLVGIIEIIAGLLVAVKPRIGGYVVALWLMGIIVNLFLHQAHYDVALRDFGLLLGALALARLSKQFSS
jgi:hypothetical protein